MGKVKKKIWNSIPKFFLVTQFSLSNYHSYDSSLANIVKIFHFLEKKGFGGPNINILKFSKIVSKYFKFVDMFQNYLVF